MSKRKWYQGQEMMAYLMPLDKESIRSMYSVRFHTINTDKWKYSFKFIYDVNIDTPFRERMKAASSKCNICFIFGKDETNARSVIIKNLESGKQVLSTYEDILEKLLTII